MTEILTIPIFLIRILKLHLNGKNIREILNLVERKISRKEEEEGEKSQQPPQRAFYLFVGSSRRNFPWRISSSMTSLTGLKETFLGQPIKSLL